MRGVPEIPGRPNQEKPLEELTHQDIMQLTREDCRRYLKEKGMRRPSWNKSQAIQQVLSLKNLFGSTADDDTKSAKENVEEASFPAPQLQRLPAASDDEARKLDWLSQAELPVLANPPAPSFSGQNVVLNTPSAQLTIFYCGNVNVYNDVPAEKAQAIMLLAAAPNHLPTSTLTPCQNQNQHQNQNQNQKQNNSFSASAINGLKCIPNATSSQMHKETPITRKASLLRFLEKKKDRSRCKTSGRASKKAPMLMGMFMHPSYWSEAAKKNPTKSTRRASPTRPSSDEQAVICSTRQHVGD